jgi:hyperosmotically inducible periplasmic protein
MALAPVVGAVVTGCRPELHVPSRSYDAIAGAVFLCWAIAGYAQGAPAAPAKAASIQIVATDFEFQPLRIEAQPGQPFEVTLVNRGKHEHSMQFRFAGAKTVDTRVKPGGMARLGFTAPGKPGNYEFYCPVPGQLAMTVAAATTLGCRREQPVVAPPPAPPVTTPAPATQLPAAAAPAEADRTVGQVDDVALTARVNAALARDPDVSALQVNVTTVEGVVQPSGSWRTRRRSSGRRRSRNVEGVREVQNKLALRA